jgi:Zn-dependent peptidase ImmA (M78 family)
MSGQESLPFIGSAGLDDDVVEVASRMRKTLGFDVKERQDIPTWTEALRRFIQLTEEAGVLVMVSGVVGSNTHRTLDVSEFRGFALVDEIGPLVFINGKDSKAAQMFTLAHELAHLWLGQSGVSDPTARTLPKQEVERWCNAVAAELLVPIDALRTERLDDQDITQGLQRLAKRFKVSTLVVLRRLFDAGHIDREELERVWGEEAQRVEKMMARRGAGGDFYNTLNLRVGRRFAQALIVSTLEGHTPFTEAFRLLGVRSTATFQEEVRRLGVKAMETGMWDGL